MLLHFSSKSPWIYSIYNFFLLDWDSVSYNKKMGELFSISPHFDIDIDIHNYLINLSFLPSICRLLSRSLNQPFVGSHIAEVPDGSIFLIELFIN